MIGLTEFKPVLNNETATKEAVLLYLSNTAQFEEKGKNN